MKKAWQHRWFILAVLISVFLATTTTRVMAAGTDAQLSQILGKGIEAFGLFLNWLLEVLKIIWE